MAIQPTFLLIADIAGYTRFMNYHRASLAHAQEIIGKLLEAVIDAVGKSLRLAKLEGDAAFFHIAYPVGTEPSLELVAEKCAEIYRAFHRRLDAVVRERATTLELDLEGLGPTQTYYMDLERYVGEVPPSPKLSYGARLARNLKLVIRSLPAELGLVEACRNFRNIDRTPPAKPAR